LEFHPRATFHGKILLQLYFYSISNEEKIPIFLFFNQVMWFSSGGTKSVLHNDDVDNINCLFSGTKELLFIDYKKYKNKVH